LCAGKRRAFVPEEPPFDTTGCGDRCTVMFIGPALLRQVGQNEKRSSIPHGARRRADHADLRACRTRWWRRRACQPEGRKLLLVQPLNLDGTDRGDAVVCDVRGGGLSGRQGAAHDRGVFGGDDIVGRPNSPIDMAVIGFHRSNRFDRRSDLGRPTLSSWLAFALSTILN